MFNRTESGSDKSPVRELLKEEDRYVYIRSSVSNKTCSAIILDPKETYVQTNDPPFRS